MASSTKWRWPLRTAVTVTLLLALFLTAFYVPGGGWWNRYKQVLVLSPAHALAQQVESIKQQQGHYPESESELLEAAGGGGRRTLTSLRQGARRLGHPLPDLLLRKPSGPEDLVLQLSSRDARVEIYAGGTVGVSRCFITQPGYVPPPWLKILEP
jgi:hypothetical protein